MKAAKWVATIVVVAVVLGFLWYEAFAVTGVTGPVVRAGVERPTPPPPKLASVSAGTGNLELYHQAHGVWSGYQALVGLEMAVWLGPTPRARP